VASVAPGPGYRSPVIADAIGRERNIPASSDEWCMIPGEGAPIPDIRRANVTKGGFYWWNFCDLLAS
jgi:hypothetical protein